MEAVIYRHAQELGRVEVADRFDFEDRCLPVLVPARPCPDYRDPRPGPAGIRVSLHPRGQGFEARPYLEFAKHVQGETHFHVMQEGQPTGFTVILR